MPDSLKIRVRNDSDSDQVWAYVTGIAIKSEGKRCILEADGTSLYFPSSPAKILQPLEKDCAIPLGAPGSAVTLKIPQLAGGRIWITRGKKLTFLLNPGPALVEPSVLNPSDPNADVDFGFAEFTLNDAQLYANISYVDFVPRLPISITLKQASGEIQHVAGMTPQGIDELAAKLKEQNAQDDRPWNKLVVERDGKVLRVLNATHGDAVGASFAGYFEPHVEEVWAALTPNKQGRCRTMRINTQAGPGILDGRVNGRGKLEVGGEEFDKPTTADILGCNSGPFTTGPNQTRNAIIPRLAAAFVRTSLLDADEHPSPPGGFYKRDPTNHYARLVHEINIDAKGYAFAYDDVQPDEGDDQSGKVNAGDPVLFAVTVGGMNAGKDAGATAVQGGEA
ncbi:beta-1,3-glucanase family protein [Microdochium nivale]|nr:beta-1,3-glucanase family protein [Microdochium nivale]